MSLRIHTSDAEKKNKTKSRHDSLLENRPGTESCDLRRSKMSVKVRFAAGAERPWHSYFSGRFFFPGSSVVSRVGSMQLGSTGGQGLPCRLPPACRTYIKCATTRDSTFGTGPALNRAFPLIRTTYCVYSVDTSHALL